MIVPLTRNSLFLPDRKCDFSIPSHNAYEKDLHHADLPCFNRPAAGSDP